MLLPVFFLTFAGRNNIKSTKTMKKYLFFLVSAMAAVMAMAENYPYRSDYLCRLDLPDGRKGHH